jgi:hypothetical protein
MAAQLLWLQVAPQDVPVLLCDHLVEDSHQGRLHPNRPELGGVPVIGLEERDCAGADGDRVKDQRACGGVGTPFLP